MTRKRESDTVTARLLMAHSHCPAEPVVSVPTESQWSAFKLCVSAGWNTGQARRGDGHRYMQKLCVGGIMFVKEVILT